MKRTAWPQRWPRICFSGTIAPAAMAIAIAATLTNIGAAEDYSRAVLVADSVLADMGGTPPLREGSKSGTTEDGRIEWTARVLPYVPPQANADMEKGSELMPIKLWQVEAEVTFTGPNGKPRSLKLSTVRVGPRDAGTK